MHAKICNFSTTKQQFDTIFREKCYGKKKYPFTNNEHYENVGFSDDEVENVEIA